MFWQLVFLTAFIFIITYDPKSGTLNHLVDSKQQSKHLKPFSTINKNNSKPLKAFKNF